MELFTRFGGFRFLRVSLAFRCGARWGFWLYQEAVNKAHNVSDYRKCSNSTGQRQPFYPKTNLFF